MECWPRAAALKVIKVWNQVQYSGLHLNDYHKSYHKNEKGVLPKIICYFSNTDILHLETNILLQLYNVTYMDAEKVWKDW